jgi:hypothetical protein
MVCGVALLLGLLHNNFHQHRGSRTNQGTGGDQDNGGRHHLGGTNLGSTIFNGLGLVGALGSELLEGNLDTGDHALFGLADPDTRIVELLVGLVGARGVTNLSLQKITLILFKSTESIPVGPLSVGINVHLDDTVLNGRLNLVVGRAGSSVHDQVDGLVERRVEHLLGVSLMLAELLGREGDVTGLVDTVHVTKGGGNGEHVANLGKGRVDGPDLLGGSVELLRVDIFVVDAIFLSSRDANLHLEPDLHGGHALKVFDANGNVLLVGFLRQVQHVRSKEGFAVLGIKVLVGLEHGIEPRKQVLGTVIRVKDDGDTVVLRDGTYVHRQGDGADGGGIGELQTLTGEESTTSIGDLDDNR